MPLPDFLPTASLQMLKLRAALLKTVRAFFDDRNYWEVQTPLMSHDPPADAHLVAFETEWWPGGIRSNLPRPSDRLYLQTSPEFCMKRLLAAGADAIYQLGSVFRNGESGDRHNPEFTMLEWYRVGDSAEAQFQLVEDLVVAVNGAVRSALSTNSDASPAGQPSTPFRRTTYQEAFRTYLGVDVFAVSNAELESAARNHSLSPPPGLERDDRDGWLNFLLAECVEPHLGEERPEFLYDYPASQAALARIRPGNPLVAQRFELYYRGIELCNGYVELTEPTELSKRIDEDSERREREGLPPLVRESRLLQAMRAGLPESVGVALGFDRLMMVATGAESIDQVIPFPIARA